MSTIQQPRFENEKNRAIQYIQNIIPNNIFRDNFERALNILITEYNQGPIIRQLNTLVNTINKNNHRTIRDSQINSHREIVTSINNIITQLIYYDKERSNAMNLDLIR